MRLVLLLAALVLAGCAGDSGPARDAPPTPDAAEEPSSVHLRHNYTDAPRTETFELVAGVYDVTIFFGSIGDQGPTACAGIDARVVVRDPAGAVAYDNSASGNVGVGGSCGEKNRQVGGTLPGGQWTVEFTGSGPVAAYVSFEAQS